MVLKDIQGRGHGVFRSIGRHTLLELFKPGLLGLLRRVLQGRRKVKLEESLGCLLQFQPKYLCFNLFSTLGFHVRSYLGEKYQCSTDKNRT